MSGIPSAAASDADPRYDDSHWPLFVIEMPPHRMSPASFAAHLATCSALFQRREHFLMLVDMSDHPPMLASQRSALTEAMRIDGERYPGLCRGVAVVGRSSFERSVAQTVGTMANVDHSLRAFATVAEARAWLSTLVLPHSAPPSRKTREPAPFPSRALGEIVSAPIDSAAPSSRRSDLVSGAAVSGHWRNVARRTPFAAR